MVVKNDKRLYPRVAVNFPVRIPPSFFAQSVDISETGLGFILDKPLLLSKAKAEIEISPGKTIETEFKVIWDKQLVESGKFRYGAAFIGLKEKDLELLRVKTANSFSGDFMQGGKVLGLSEIKTTIRTQVKLYKRRAAEIEKYLSEHPGEWGKFQNEFNLEVNSIFRGIMNFEKINLSKGLNSKVLKLKRLFLKKIRGIFMQGVFVKWCFEKPFGYAGDFKIIDDLYQNNPTTTGYPRLFDNYLQMTAMAIAVRNRKEDFKRMIIDVVNNKKPHSDPIRIMCLASGPCRDIQEVLASGKLLNNNVFFDCYDIEKAALDFGKNLLRDFPDRVRFFQKSAVKLGLAKDVTRKVDTKYDMIYATGLYDYFNFRLAVEVTRNLKELLTPGGVLMVANVRDKYSNPTLHFMDWVTDWQLIYRDEKEFGQIFIDAGFAKERLTLLYEQQGIMQYIVASQNKG